MTMAANLNLRVLSAALLCAAVAASTLPLSSAGVSLLSLTCRHTAHERLCVDLLSSDARSAAAVSVQQLAVIALSASRNFTRDAVWRVTELGASDPAPPDRDLLARCRAVYAECLRGTTAAIALVAAARFRDADGAAAALPGYPARCEALFGARGVPSPLERTDREMGEKLTASAEIVQLLTL